MNKKLISLLLAVLMCLALLPVGVLAEEEYDPFEEENTGAWSYLGNKYTQRFTMGDVITVKGRISAMAPRSLVGPEAGDNTVTLFQVEDGRGRQLTSPVQVNAENGEYVIYFDTQKGAKLGMNELHAVYTGSSEYGYEPEVAELYIAVDPALKTVGYTAGSDVVISLPQECCGEYSEFQWYVIHEGLPLTLFDNEECAGANTAELTIFDAGAELNGKGFICLSLNNDLQPAMLSARGVIDPEMLEELPLNVCVAQYQLAMNSNVPSTGDNTPILALSALMLVSAAAVWMLLRRKACSL